MTCDGISDDRLVDAAAGRAEAGLREHLLCCSDCRGRFEAVAALAATLRESEFGQDLPISPASDQAMRALISRQAAERRRARGPRRAFWRFLPLAAAAALLFWFLMVAPSIIDPRREPMEGPPPALPPLAGDASPGRSGELALLRDANGDGRVNAADADFIADAVAQGEEDQLDKDRCDVNFDGKVNILDAQRILQIWLAEERSKDDGSKKH